MAEMLADICDLFCMLHDGTIVSHRHTGDSLALDVEIPYLAERIQPTFTLLHLKLENVRNLSFRSWPRNSESELPLIVDIREIFKPELSILECSMSDGIFEVVCSQSAETFNYCGGKLFFEADSVDVRDEEGRPVTIESLKSICRAYWAEFSNKTPNS